MVSNLITRYAIVEKLYLQHESKSIADDIMEQLSQAIFKLYTAVLVYLSKAKRYYSRHTAGMLAVVLLWSM